MTDIERFTLIKHSSNSTFLNLIFSDLEVTIELK